MQNFSLFSFSARVRTRWNNSWLNERVELTDGLLGACRHERVRPRLAVLALAALLIGQTILPSAMLISEVQAEELRRKDFAKAQAKENEAKKPIWVKSLERRAEQNEGDRNLRLAQFNQSRGNNGGNGDGFGRPPVVPVPGSKPGEIVPSQEVECVDCEVDVRALDLSKVPGERDLRRAGQLGGALNPTRPASPEELGWKLDKLMKKAEIEGGLRGKLPKKDPRERGLQRAKAKYERAQAINMDFGQAIQEWNKHNYGKAAKMFEKHMKDFPESPWAGEAVLHLGCDAKYNGRFAEAQAIYSSLLEKTSDKPNKKLREKKKERKARKGAPSEAEIDAAVNEASQGAASLEAAVDRLDVTGEADDESFEIHMKAKMRWADLDIATGQLESAKDKLRDLLKIDTNWERRTWAMHWMRNIGMLAKNGRDLRACGPRALGYVLAQFGHKEAGQKIGRMQAPRENGATLTELETMARKGGVKMVGFKSTPEELANLPLPLIVHYDFTRLQAKSSKADKSDAIGHYLVVKAVNEKQKTVQIFDPQEGRTYHLDFKQLSREWSGKGLMTAAGQGKGNGEATIRLAAQDTTSAALRVAALSRQEMDETAGGCCGIPRPPTDLGCEDVNIPCFGDCPQGSPVTSFNPINLNMFVTDTPIWYKNEIGPNVNISLSYNSQSSVQQNTTFGKKWMFNYSSYIVQDTGAGGGVATLFDADGSQTNFIPNSAGGFDGETGEKRQLTKTGGTRYEVKTKGGNTRIYDIPAGTTSLQPFLIAEVDRWGNGLTFAYDSQVRLTTITDALSRVTTLKYDNSNRVTSAWDPFGRHATFAYDAQDNLIECVDTEGQAFQYTYDPDRFITSINTAQGPWRFKHQIPGRDTWEQMYVTITDPAGGVERYTYGGAGGPIQHIDKRNQTTTYTIGAVVGQKGKITSITQADGSQSSASYDPNSGKPTSFRANGGAQVNVSYNAYGKPSRISKPDGTGTNVIYGPNGEDIVAVINAEGETIVTHTYNSNRQIIRTEHPGGQYLTYTYAAWGAPLTVSSANHTVAYNYDNKGQISTVREDGVIKGGFTYDAIGRVKTRTDDRSRTWGYTYDNLDRVTKVTYPDGTFSSATYVCCGLPGVVTDRAGRKSYFDYDQLKRLVRTQDPAGNAIQYDYDANDNMVRMVDKSGSVTKWQYDSRDRLAKKIFPDATFEAMAYNGDNQLTSRRDARGQNTSYLYDTNGNLTKIDLPNSTDVEMFYDALGRPYKVTDAIGATNLFYDVYSRIKRQDGPFANDDISYDYDGFGRPTQLRLQKPDGTNQQVNYGYDSQSRLSAIGAATGTFSYSYFGDTSILTSTTLGNGSQTAFSYDAQDRLTGVNNRTASGANLSQFGYALDTRNVRTAMQAKMGVDPIYQVDYTYDPIDQLVREVSNHPTAADKLDIAYGYDASGNRAKVIDASAGQSSTTRYKDNALHQYTAITTSGGANTYAANQQFDERGNLALVEGSVSGQNSAIGKTRYFYDDANNLVSAVRQDAQGINQSKTEFGYDAFSRRRLARSSTWTNNAWQVVPGSERRYLYDGMQIVQERDENNALLVSNVWESDGGAVAGLLSRTVHGQNGAADASYYYHYDGNGNVVQLTDASGAEVARYRYDAFGNTLEARGAQAQANPYRFSTKRYEAAVGAYDFGFRFYIASQGRFLTRDPFGESGGINLYRYVSNSPVNGVDPLGLAPNIDWGEVTRGLKDGAIDEIKSLIPPPPWEIPGMLWDAIQQAKDLFERIKEEGFDICKLKESLGMLGEVGDILDTLWDAYNAYQRGDSYELGQKVGKLMAKGVIAAAGAGAAKLLPPVLTKGGGGCNSFAAGTLVLMADGSLKRIEDVQTGDEVLAKDEATGNVEKKKVTSKVESASTVLALTLSNGETLLVTDEHPLYVEGLGFREAAQAGIGTSIVTRAGPSVQVVQVEQREGEVAVYNFSVEGSATYFVGKDALWVHNSKKNCGGKGADSGGDQTHRKGGGKFTEPEYPNRVIVDENGVLIEHNPGDHGPSHAHVTGEGPDTKIGQNGKPVEGQPELSAKQQKACEANKSKIRSVLGKKGRRWWFDNYDN